VDLLEFKKQMDEWTQEEGVSYKILQPTFTNPTSDISNDNIWWTVFKGVLQDLNCKIDPQIFPAATDSRYIRNLGIPAFGFSPMNHTPILLHDHNEFLNEEVFLKGIDYFVKIIDALANLP